MHRPHDITGILLAGGLSTRMGGGDKNLLLIGGKSILQHVIERVRPQVSRLLLNANGESTRFQNFGLPVIPDSIQGNLGPLAGILSGMEWSLKNVPECEWLLTLPTDAPFIPLNMVSAFLAQLKKDGSDIVCAVTKERTHPPFALWRISLAAELRSALVLEGLRKIDAWTARFSVSYVNFDDLQHDPFFNINNPKNLQEARIVFEESFNNQKSEVKE